MLKDTHSASGESRTSDPLTSNQVLHSIHPAPLKCLCKSDPFLNYAVSKYCVLLPKVICRSQVNVSPNSLLIL